MSLFTQLLIRVIIIVAVTNILEFYIISKRHLAITPLLVFEIILVTLVPLAINIWYCLHKANLV